MREFNKDNELYIMEASIEAIMKLLSRHVTDKEIPVVFVGSRNNYREAFRREGEIDYPLFAVMIESANINNTGYHNYSTAYGMGFRGGYNESEKIYDHYYLKAITLNLTVQFMSQDSSDTNRFIKRFLFLDRKLNFELMLDNEFPIGITVNTNDSIQVPEIPFDNREGVSILETILEVSTYIGFLNKVPAITSLIGNINLVSVPNNTSIKISSIETSNE